MNFDNQNNNDGFNEARRIIADAQRFRPMGLCCQPNNNGGGITGPTGPTGPVGPTERLFKSSNSIIIDSS